MNGIVNVYKEAGMTSFDVVAKIVLVGYATRFADYLSSVDKEYIAELKLGERSQSYDNTSEIEKVSDKIVSEKDLKNVLHSLIGKISLKDALKRAEGRKPKSKTTYKDIQNYVEENYGFKVHTAYIAEVKRNLGLPMYDAPNAVEELKRPRSHPTEKMVLAIKETLAHFETI